MKYNHIPDQCFASISGELDKYTSPLFMCYTHLLIAKGRIRLDYTHP